MMRGEDDDREARQFRRMEKCLLRFEAGDLSLSRTVAGPKGLLAALEQKT